ncbi:MAG: PH domain-containing protein [Rhodobacteraceae bacterium]|nr:PH domain-containing protein [Paracoccaceae bacterium]
MSGHDKDFDFELMPGVPAGLPKGEEILWQGHPQAMALAREAYKINWITGYLVVIALWRAGGAYADGGAAMMAAKGLPYLALAAAAYGVVYLLAWAQARASIYTITSARVIMRIGAALPVTYTIPFVRIAAARLDLKPKGTGTIAIEITEGMHLSYAVLWPHLRPGFARHTQPAFRCIADASNVARLLSESAQAKLNEPVVTPVAAGSALAAE